MNLISDKDGWAEEMDGSSHSENNGEHSETTWREVCIPNLTYTKTDYKAMWTQNGGCFTLEKDFCNQSKT